jgi:hypothetical protein
MPAYQDFPEEEIFVFSKSLSSFSVIREPWKIDSDSWIKNTTVHTPSDSYIKKLDNEATIESTSYIQIADIPESLDSLSHIAPAQYISSISYIKKLDTAKTRTSLSYVKIEDIETTPIYSDSVIIKGAHINSDSWIFKENSKTLLSISYIKKFDNEKYITSESYISMKITIDSSLWVKRRYDKNIRSLSYIYKQDTEKNITSESAIVLTRDEDITTESFIVYTRVEELGSDSFVYTPLQYSISYIKVLDNDEVIDSDSAVLRVEDEEIGSESYIKIGVTAAILLHPLTDEEYWLNDETERVRFTIPSSVDRNVDMHIQLSDNASFSPPLWDFFSWQHTDRWTYDNGVEYISWPAEGIPPIRQGQEGRFKIQGIVPESLINRGRWYIRARGLVR